MGISLQPRDTEVVRFVFAHRVASFSQLSRNFFPDRDKTTTSKRLKRLCKEGFIKSGFTSIKSDYAERYYMPLVKAHELVRHYWGFEIDNPLYRSESVSHDLRLAELSIRLEKLSQFRNIFPENLLQSSSALATDPSFGELVKTQADAALLIEGKKSGKNYLFSLELELSAKSFDQYKSKLNAYYLTSGIQGVLYVCADQFIMNLLAKADAEIRKDKKSILYLALENDALGAIEKITFRNAKDGSIDFK